MLRLEKRGKFIAWTVVAIALMVATVPLAIWVTHTQSAQLENTQRRCDGKQQTMHTVAIKNNLVSPLHTSAKQCDSLTIINRDNTLRLMAFGKHDNHISYDGVSERVLGKDQSLTVRLGSLGTYRFHDHEHDAVHGDFTVTQ